LVELLTLSEAVPGRELRDRAVPRVFFKAVVEVAEFVCPRMNLPPVTDG